MRDALTMGPRSGEDTITPHTRPPADDDGDHMLVRTVVCLEGSVEVELVCEPVFDYGRTPGRVDAGRRRPPHGRRDRRRRRRSGSRPTWRSASRATGCGPATRCAQGEQVYCSLSWAEDLAVAAERRRGQRAARRHHALLARLARPGPAPRPPLARADPALGAGDQGPDLHADRRDGRRARRRRCPRRRAASATGTTATPGCATRRSRCRRCTGSTSTGRPTSSCSSSPTSSPTTTARCRSCTGSTAAATSPSRRATTSPATPARARCGSATAPSTSARTTSSAPCSTRSCSTRAAASGCRGGCGRSSQAQAECATQVWREPDQGIWEARGEPQHYVSSKLMCWVALDRAAKLAEIRGDPELQDDLGRDRRRDPGRHPRARRRRDGVLRQHYDTDALDASTLLAALFGFLPGDDERLRKTRAGDRRRADRGRLRPALPHRRDRRRPVGQGGQLPDLLVLARLGAGDRRRACSAPAT